jgi:hypothetical protein
MIAKPMVRELAKKIYDKVLEMEEGGPGGARLYDYCIDPNHPDGFDETHINKLIKPIEELLLAALPASSSKASITGERVWNALIKRCIGGFNARDCEEIAGELNIGLPASNRWLSPAGSNEAPPSHCTECGEPLLRYCGNPNCDAFPTFAPRAALSRTPQEGQREYPHLLICNGDRRFPAGEPGHSCCCLNIDAQMMARALRAQERQPDSELEKLRELSEKATPTNHDHHDDHMNVPIYTNACVECMTAQRAFREFQSASVNYVRKELEKLK